MGHLLRRADRPRRRRRATAAPARDRARLSALGRLRGRSGARRRADDDLAEPVVDNHACAAARTSDVPRRGRPLARRLARAAQPSRAGRRRHLALAGAQRRRRRLLARARTSRRADRGADLPGRRLARSLSPRRCDRVPAHTSAEAAAVRTVAARTARPRRARAGRLACAPAPVLGRTSARSRASRRPDRARLRPGRRRLAQRDDVAAGERRGADLLPRL